MSLGYRATWSGRGPDGDRHLLVDERGDWLFGAHTGGAQCS
jgi:hypothetical protein